VTKDSHDKRLIRSQFGHYSVNPEEVEQMSLSDYYRDVYFQHNLGSYAHEYSGIEIDAMRREQYLRLASYVEVTGSEEPGKFLDIGCGEGWNMLFMTQREWAAIGLDFSDAGIKLHNPTLEDRLHTGDFFDCLAELIDQELKFDLIYLGNVLEHVSTPELLLNAVSALSSGGGVIQIRVPNDFSRLQLGLIEAKFVDKPYWVALPDHLQYFDSASLECFVESLRFSIKDAFSSFPIDWFLANEFSNYVADSTRGKAAHNARLVIEGILDESNSQTELLNFYRSLYQVGMGRDLTLTLQAVG